MSTQQTDRGGTDALPTISPGDNQRVSEYVQKLVARESFFRVVDRIQERNKDVDPKQFNKRSARPLKK